MEILENELKKLLLSFDDLEYLEGAKDFDYINEMKKIYNVKKQIENIIKKDLIIDDQIQDASFFIDLMILEESEEKRRRNGEGCVYVYDICIRFSTFGNMVTIFNTTKTNMHDKYPIDKIIDILKNNVYTYINPESLQVQYDGINKYIDEDSTWWDRYFDYL